MKQLTYNQIAEEFRAKKFEPKSLVYSDNVHGRIHVCVRNVHDRPEVFFLAEKVTDSFFSAAHIQGNAQEAHSLQEALWMIGIEAEVSPVEEDGS